MTPADIAERRARFRALHENGCFLLPNPWDVGSARRLEKLGFPALASSSAAAAWAIGKQDYEITLGDSLAQLELLVPATNLPLNADFENGFSDDPNAIAANVTKAVATGVAGLSIEDRAFGTATLREYDHAVACIRAARAAIDASGHDVMLVARTEAYLVGRKDYDLAVGRLTAFADAGADVLFAPGMRDFDEIAATVKAVAPKPVNVVAIGGPLDEKTLAEIGVRRISTGGQLAWAAWSGFDAAAERFHASLN